MVEKDTILINIMYTGDYTNENIGHEIINLYKTDNGENYIYISPYGKMHKDRYDKVETVLLARPAGKNRLEIIAKAKGLEQLNSEYQDEDTKIDDDFYKEKGINKDDSTKYFLAQILNENDIWGLDENEIKNKLYFEWVIKNNKKLKTISNKFLMSRKIFTPKQIRNIQYKFIWAQLNGYIQFDKFSRKEITDAKIKFINKNNITINLNEFKNKINKELLKKFEKDKIAEKVEKLLKYANQYRELSNGKNLEIDIKYLENETQIAKYWKKRRKLHNRHIELIKEKKIKYGGVYLNEIIKDNHGGDLNAYFTFKSTNVLRPTKSIYIEYTSPNKSNDENDTQSNELIQNKWSLTKKEQANAEYKGKKLSANGNYITFMFENIKFRNQSCMKYVTYKKQDFLNKLEKINNENSKISRKLNNIIQNLKDNNIKYDVDKKILIECVSSIITNESDKKDLNDILNSKEDEIYKKIQKEILDSNLWKEPEESTTTVENDNYSDYEQFFLDITGNQYDELAYSNMLAYFFRKYPDLFVDFANKKLKVKNIGINKTFEVIREENNIDLLIETEKDVFVIENKVKSHINGEKYVDEKSPNLNNSEENNNSDFTNKKENVDEIDKKEIEYTNQLIKYYNYIENKYPNKEKHYFIFKPDYNNIEDELLQKIKGIDNKADVEDIIKKYHHINYSDIYSFYKDKPIKPCNIENEDLLIDYVYFTDFVKALKRHIDSTDNTNELLMKYKFKKAIEKAKKTK